VGVDRSTGGSCTPTTRVVPTVDRTTARLWPSRPAARGQQVFLPRGASNGQFCAEQTDRRHAVCGVDRCVVANNVALPTKVHLSCARRRMTEYACRRCRRKLPHSGALKSSKSWGVVVYHAVRGVDASRAYPDLRRPATGGIGCAYLDIETTGLDPFRSRIVVVGILHAAPGATVVEQWFADSPIDEGPLIHCAADHVRQFNQIVTYNGTRFDLPFLRFRSTRFNLTWPQAPHNDLLPLARGWRARIGCSDCRLQTVIASLGLACEEASSGGAVPQIYRRWIRQGDPADREWVLRHNMDDLVWLPALAERLLEHSADVPSLNRSGGPTARSPQNQRRRAL